MVLVPSACEHAFARMRMRTGGASSWASDERLPCSDIGFVGTAGAGRDVIGEALLGTDDAGTGLGADVGDFLGGGVGAGDNERPLPAQVTEAGFGAGVGLEGLG